jgi:hypothetical protein
MSIPNMQERTLAELSQIEVRYFLVPSRRKPHLEILVIRYIGTYPFGSGGNDDARFMCAMAKAGVSAFEPWGVIHDLSELSYEWGDMLDIVFGVGPEFAPSPVAVVVGPRCEEAVRTLLLGENSQEPIEKLGYLFRNLSDAWAFVADRIE